MTIKIVTDSTADIPSTLAKELGITVVPLYVLFGDKTYRDHVDITEDEFYQRLTNDPIHPTTSQPTPQDFVNVYRELSQQADGIVSIHISSKLSGTCNSALQAKELVVKECPVEVVDSEMVSMGLGLLAIEAAAFANSGKDLQQVAEEVKQLITGTHVWALFDTLKYLALGGRIGKAKALLGSVLNIKPILVVKDGEMAPASQVRTRAKGIGALCDYVNTVIDIQDLAVVHSTTPDEAQVLADRIGTMFDKDRIRLARLGPTLGVHAGPGALVVALRGKGIR
ncbi:DegV family protein [Chloroflexota bacterium]